ncbi:hypothetical protein AAHT77_06615 [Klebsiella pneumoniae]
MTDITELALMKGQKVEAPYYLAECTECGEMYSSSKLIESRNYFDGDADCYCPHCNAEDADIADLGSGEQPAVMAWNYQQARIDALVEALEKAQQKIDELENDEVRQRLANAEHQLYMAELAKNNLRASRKAQFRKRKAAEQRIAELESRTVTVKLTDIDEYLAEVHDKTLNRAFRLLAEGVRAGDVAAMRAAGIKWEAE